MRALLLKKYLRFERIRLIDNELIDLRCFMTDYLSPHVEVHRGDPRVPMEETVAAMAELVSLIVQVT
jgi:hypothetical protein